MTNKDDKPLSRPERRRILREQRKGNGATTSHKDVDPQKRSQRKLVVGISLLLSLCAVAALAYGGKLWIHSPTWLIVIGWTGAIMLGWIGLGLWVKYKESFQIGPGWVFRFALSFVMGVVVGYTYSHMIRQAGENLQMNQIKKKHASVIGMTSNWNGSSWKGDKCQKFESDLTALTDDIIGKDLPPTGVSYRLLLAVSQIGYEAGCQIDFQEHIKALVDEDGRWKKTAPWQYNTLRMWVNQTGWPRADTGCWWEVKRAQVDGNDRLAKQIEKSCAPKTGLRKLEPWDPNKLTIMNTQRIKAEDEGLKEIERLVKPNHLDDIENPLETE